MNKILLLMALSFSCAGFAAEGGGTGQTAPEPGSSGTDRPESGGISIIDDVICNLFSLCPGTEGQGNSEPEPETKDEDKNGQGSNI